ncbi:hypothetical protein [Collimonas fungivorans]|uniref:Uncharacterized protein n=1 Tax=Collimonas fungivorans (strain Ter331) TaxID=1005048 RepID=G0AAY3_COLFT|nr:hypothetical protein [Collimonas fungivorans]AEK63507.1 hypothetical protein CFU_3683 [Collimonas fungivorans Ter331]
MCVAKGLNIWDEIIKGQTMKRAGLVAGLLVLLNGCTSVGLLDGTTPAPTDNESIFIMGVTPDNYRVSLFPGSIKDGVFHQNIFRSAAVYAAAKDGYVIGKSSAGDVLAITNVRVVKDSSSVLQGANFKPCGNVKTMVFAVPKGKVIYLGDVAYQFVGQKVEVRYGQNIEAAQAYLDKNFPALRGKLEPLPVDLLPSQTSCTATPMYFPVYIGKSR